MYDAISEANDNQPVLEPTPRSEVDNYYSIRSRLFYQKSTSTIIIHSCILYITVYNIENYNTRYTVS